MTQKGNLQDRMVEWIASRLIRDYKDVSKHEVRVRYGYLEAWVSIAGNLALFAVKYILGTMINSISLMTDAFHTLSDVVTSMVVLLGFRASAAGPDEEHPFGHGRVESIATLIIAILLIIVGLDFLGSSLVRIRAPEAVRGSLVVAGVMVFSGIAKEAMAVFSIKLGQRIASSTLVADAWHHRSDAVASGLVAIAIVAAIMGYHRVDAIFGLGVAALIVYTGVDLARSSASYLIGKRPTEATVSRIVQCASSIEGVDGVHGIEVHDYGERKSVSLHIEVEPGINVRRAHEIASNVEKRISRDMNVTATVHIEPAPPMSEAKRRGE